jgi:hypothetical protein
MREKNLFMMLPVFFTGAASRTPVPLMRKKLRAGNDLFLGRK